MYITSDYLDNKIHAFMQRKDGEFPQLQLLEKWNDYEFSPKHTPGPRTNRWNKK